MSVDSEVTWSISTHPYMGWSVDLPIVIDALSNTLFSFYKNIIVFLTKAEYSYFSVDFRLKIFL